MLVVCQGANWPPYLILYTYLTSSTSGEAEMTSFMKFCRGAVDLTCNIDPTSKQAKATVKVY